MKQLYFLLFFAGCSNWGFAQSVNKDSVLLFSYFKGNGEDGLHFAYSHDGLKWKALKNDSSFLTPAAGHDKLMRDPCIIRGGDGFFHMTWTVSWTEKSIGYASSKDLVNWSEQQDIPVMEHEPGTWNCWAPEIFYDVTSKQYMIYWASTIPGRFAAGDTSGDDKYNHRMYYTLSKDLKTFSKAAILYNKGFNVIDATIQKNGSNYVMFLKNETLKPVPEKNIRMAFSKNLNTDYSDASVAVTGKYWAEGPTVVYWKDKWVLYFDKYMEHKYGALTSLDMKTWTDISDELELPDGIRHGTIVKITAKEFEKLSVFK